MTEVSVYKIRPERMARSVKNILSVQGLSIQQVDNERFTTSASSEQVETAIQFARMAENISDAEFQRLIEKAKQNRETT